MQNPLEVLIEGIGNQYRDVIDPQSRFYLEVDLGKEAAKAGMTELHQQWKGVNAIVPVKSDRPGMKVLIDGRTFVNYTQFANGVVVPGYVAEAVPELERRSYTAHEDMMLIF
ncbi:MAG: hypothetical protein AB1547_11430 [Thermodesulfobacteriota bacterium]